MAINTKELHFIADHLFANIKNEDGFRSSTNRAYYSAYHECCALAKKFSYFPKDPKKKNHGHKEIVDWLVLKNQAASYTQQKRDMIKLGRMLNQAKDLRAKADYRDNLTYSFNQAKDALVFSDNILTLAKKI